LVIHSCIVKAELHVKYQSSKDICAEW
jgi:hypothetical protein